MKLIKRLLLTLIVLTAAIVAVAFFIAANIDPNDYKQEIQTAAERATGRKLHLEGDIKLSLFPTLSFDLERVSLDNPPGFEGRFVSVERVRAELDLLPLLQKRLEIGKITLQKPRLTLYTLSDGRTNWKNLTEKIQKNTDGAAADQPADAASTTSDARSAIAGFSLAGIAIEDATVIWRDTRSREHIRADTVTLETGALMSGKAVEFNLGGIVSDKHRQLSADLNLNADVLFDLANQRVSTQALDAEIGLRGQQLSADLNLNADVLFDLANQRVSTQALDAEIALRRGDTKPLDIRVNTDAEIDLARNTGEFKQLLVAANDARVESAVSVTGLLSDKPKISAKLKSNEFDLRTWTDALDLPLPKTADDRAFRKFSATADVTAGFGNDQGRAVIRQSDVTLDDSRLRIHGNLAWEPVLRMTLDGEVDRIDASRYFPPAEAGKNNAVKNIPVTDLRTRIHAEDNKIDISIPAATIFGGHFDGTLSMNTGTASEQGQVTYRSSGKASKIKLEQLLAALAIDDKRLLEGLGALSYQLTAKGHDEKTLTRSLAGSVKLKLEKGSFKNPQLARNIESVIAFFEKRPAAKAGEELFFNDAKANFSIRQGVADNRDLEVDMPLLKMRGAGRIDFVRSRTDYQLRVGLREKQADTDSEEQIYIPIKISGALDDPKYSVDFEKALREEGRRQLQRKLKKEKKQLRNKLEKKKEEVTEKAREKLNEILKGTLKLPF